MSPLVTGKRFKHLKYLVAKLNFNFQMDIVYVTSINEHILPPHNRNIKYLLVIVDCLSRFMYVYALKTKTSHAVSKHFVSFLKQQSNKSIHFFSDRGSEFFGETEKLLKKKGIKHYFGLNESIKASLSERSIRTLKHYIWRYIEHTKNLTYIDILPKIVDTINSSVHSRLGFSPKEITTKHVPYIFEKLHSFNKIIRNPKFSKNDTVHISKIPNFFDKETKKKFSSEIFIVDKIYRTDPYQFSIIDFDQEQIKGKFYEQELTFANITSNTKHPFVVLRENKNNVFIHFINFSNTYDRWISKRSILNLKK